MSITGGGSREDGGDHGLRHHDDFFVIVVIVVADVVIHVDAGFLLEVVESSSSIENRYSNIQTASCFERMTRLKAWTKRDKI